MAAKLPAVRIEDGKVVERAAAADLPKAEIFLAGRFAEALASARTVAAKLEQAGFKIYGRESR